MSRAQPPRPARPAEPAPGPRRAPGQRAPVVEVRGVCFAYDGERVLHDITLTVAAGDFLGIIGPNGSGKTTFVKIVVGLLRPQCGTVRLFGTALPRFRQWHRVGYVPQRVASLEARFPATVAEVVQSGRAARAGVGRSFSPADRRAVDWALEMVGLADLRDRPIGTLSAGQQQRAFIARAMASEPELLVLDEPLVGVDADAQARFYALLRHLHRDLGVTLIMVSHDVGVIASEVTTLACLNGILVYHGAPAAFLESDALRALYHTGVRVVSHVH
ncbi:MAG: metal ABC transporter ATP-binding protein [Armatimonadota bacterium]|nr:metal ABC transporter ATP-binding protein [Armatimonadota bacterium]